jgi:hypothetical protein
MKEWVFIVPACVFSSLGRVVDVSKGGLAFHYVPQSTWKAGPGEGPFEVNIFATLSDSLIKRLPVVPIYDREVQEKLSSHAVPLLRRCGVEFKGLLENDLLQLEDFIENFGVNRG